MTTNQRIQDVVVFQMGRIMGAAISKKLFNVSDFSDPVMEAVDARVAELEAANKDLALQNEMYEQRVAELEGENGVLKCAIAETGRISLEWSARANTAEKRMVEVEGKEGTKQNE